MNKKPKDISEIDNRTKNANFLKNINTIKKASGNITDAKFNDITNVGRTTLHRCRNNSEYVPGNNVLSKIANIYGLNQRDLIYTEISENFLLKHSDYFSQAFIATNEDDQIATLLDSHFDIKIKAIITAFNTQGMSIEFLTTKQFTPLVTLLPKNVTNEFNKRYTLKDFVSKLAYSKKIGHPQKNAFKRYTDYYKPIFYSKLEFIASFSRLSKSNEDIYASLSVRIKKPKEQYGENDNGDIYETIKELSLKEFYDYSTEYYNIINKVFDIE